MGSDDFASETQPQAGSLDSSAAGGVGPVKTLKNPVPVSRWNLHSGVGDSNQRVIRLRLQLELNHPSVMIVFDGIAGEVLQRLFQKIRVGVDVDASSL